MIPLMALVTLIRGVWREGVTFQMTKYPAKIAIMKTPKLMIKARSVTKPRTMAIARVMRRVKRALPKLELYNSRFYRRETRKG